MVQTYLSKESRRYRDGCATASLVSEMPRQAPEWGARRHADQREIDLVAPSARLGEAERHEHAW